MVKYQIWVFIHINGKWGCKQSPSMFYYLRFSYCVLLAFTVVSHFSTVLFVLSAASLPTSTASCTPCPPATLAKLSHNCPTWHVLLDVRTKLRGNWSVKGPLKWVEAGTSFLLIPWGTGTNLNSETWLPFFLTVLEVTHHWHSPAPCWALQQPVSQIQPLLHSTSLLNPERSQPKLFICSPDNSVSPLAR